MYNNIKGRFQASETLALYNKHIKYRKNMN